MLLFSVNRYDLTLKCIHVTYGERSKFQQMAVLRALIGGFSRLHHPEV